MADVVKNMELWNRVEKTDPKFVKSITGKKYKGDSPNPYWIVKRLTETFGPCGQGWGWEVVQSGFQTLPGDYVLHYSLVKLWYDQGSGVRYTPEQFGCTPAGWKKADGSGFVQDEDAPKKSVTDGFVKCASYLGFAGDIFLGKWNDSKYVESLTEEKKADTTAFDKYTKLISECTTKEQLTTYGEGIKAGVESGAINSTQRKELGKLYDSKSKELK